MVDTKIYLLDGEWYTFKQEGMAKFDKGESRNHLKPL